MFLCISKDQNRKIPCDGMCAKRKGKEGKKKGYRNEGWQGKKGQLKDLK